MKTKNNLILLAFGIMAFACDQDEAVNTGDPTKDNAGDKAIAVAPLPKCRILSIEEIEEYEETFITKMKKITTDFKYNDSKQLLSSATNSSYEVKILNLNSSTYEKSSILVTYLRNKNGRISETISKYDSKKKDNISGETSTSSSTDTALYYYTPTDYKPNKIGLSSLTYDNEGRISKSEHFHEGTSTSDLVDGKYVQVPKYTYKTIYTTKYTYDQGGFDITKSSYRKREKDDGTVMSEEEHISTTYYNVDDKNTVFKASLFRYERHDFTHNIIKEYNEDKVQIGYSKYEYNEQGFPTKSEIYTITNGKEALSNTSNYKYECE